MSDIRHRLQARASKVWYRSKTILASLALAAVGLADTLGAINLNPLFDLFGIPESKQAGFSLLVFIVFAVLRFTTSGAVTATKKDDPA